MRNRITIAAALLATSVTLVACNQPENATDNTTTGSVGAVTQENSLEATDAPKDETKPEGTATE